MTTPNPREAEGRVAITGDDQISQLVDEVRQRLGKVSGETKKAREATDDYKKSVLTAREQVALLATGLNSAFELGGKLRDALGSASEFMGRQAQIQAQQAQFERQIDQSSRRLVEFRQASAGAVSDDALRKFAVLANNAGLTAEQIRRVLDVSTRISAAGFGDVADVSEKLLDGIVGASDSVYEAYGIVVDIGTETEAWASKNGIAKDAIDKTVQSQAALDVITGKLADKFSQINIDESVVLRAQQLSTELGNIQSRWSRETSEAGIAMLRLLGVVSESKGQQFSGAYDEVSRRMAEIRDFSQNLKSENLNAYGAKFGDLAVDVRDAADVTEMLRDRQAGLAKVLEGNADALAAYSGQIEHEARLRADALGPLADEEARRREIARVTEELNTLYGTQNVLLAAETKAREEAAAAATKQTEANLVAARAALRAGVVGQMGIPGADIKALQKEAEAQLAALEAQAADLERFRKTLPAKGASRGGGSRRGGTGAEPRGPAAGGFFPTGLDQAAYGAQGVVPGSLSSMSPLESALAGVGSVLSGGEDGPSGATTGKGMTDRLRDTELIFNSLIGTSDALASSVRMLGDAFGTDLSQGLAQLEPSIRGVEKAINAFSGANSEATGGYVNGVGLLLQAGGQLTAGFIENEAAKAGILAVMEAGAALASYPDFVGMAIHGAAAAIYTGVAVSKAGARSGGGGARGAPRTPQMPQLTAPPSAREDVGATYVVHLNGPTTYIGSDEERAARDLRKMLRRVDGRTTGGARAYGV